MKTIPLPLTLKQSLATLTEGGFTEVVEAVITQQVKEGKGERTVVERHWC